jgi:prepilin-type N-terminal cleavage/methylation domain-containing protein
MRRAIGGNSINADKEEKYATEIREATVETGGFTMIEMMIATVVMVVGLVGWHSSSLSSA